MNIIVYVILKTLSNTFEMVKSIFKDHKCAYMRVKGSLSSPTKKKKKNQIREVQEKE